MGSLPSSCNDNLTKVTCPHLRHVDWDGVLTVSTVQQQEVMVWLSAVLESRLSDTKLGERMGWRVGQRCVAVFPLDERWHRGLVRALGEGQAYVTFVDYGSTSWCSLDKLRNDISTQETPVQCHTLRLAGIRPRNLKKWDRKTLDLLHRILVDQELEVNVAGPLTCLPQVAIVHLNGVDINQMLLSNGFAMEELSGRRGEQR